MTNPEGKGSKLPKLALMFLSGKEAGKVLPLPPGQELVLGRGKAAGVLVDDEKASRKHARIVMEDGEVVIEDLGSANGTLVNGKAIERAELKDGDTVRIGKAGFKIIGGIHISAEAQSWWEEQEAASRGKTIGSRAQAKQALMSGALKTVSLVDLLQLLVNALKSGTLVIREHRDTGRIYLRDGQLIYASLNDRTASQPQKTVYRLLGWKEGAFELWPLPDETFQNEITEPASSLLLDGVQQADELAGFSTNLPSIHTRLVLARPLPELLSGLSREELDIIQLAHDHDSLLAVLDSFTGSDLEAYRLLLPLMERKVLVPAASGHSVI